jgi:hypothetical protein
MVGQGAMTKLAGLSDAFTLPSNGYPVLKVFNKTPVIPDILLGDVNGDGKS